MISRINMYPGRRPQGVVWPSWAHNDAQGLSMLRVNSALSWVLKRDPYLRNASPPTPHAQMQSGEPGGA